MKKMTVMIAAIVLLIGWVGFAQVQEKPREKPAPASKTDEARDPDEEAIRRSATAFTTAYNAHDAKGIAELFALKAEFTDEEGNLIKGRDAIAQSFAELFKKYPKCKSEIEIDSIRILTPNVALEEGVIHGQPDPEDAPNVSSYVAIHVKVEGKWLIASVADFEAGDQELTAHDHLQQLDWMVGEWLDESASSTVKSTCRWDESGNYLLHDFYLQLGKGITASGSLRIGWDPLSGQLKSWTFDADSGYSEGLWVRVDDEWIVRSHGVNAEGKVTSSINVFRFINKDTMTWRSYDRVVGGQPAEEIPENVIKRHAPAPGH